MNEVGEVTTIVEDQVEGLTVGEEDGLLDAPDVLLVRLPLPGVHRHTAGSNGGRCVVLRRKKTKKEETQGWTKTGGYIELVLRIRIFHMEPDPELFVPRPGTL